jgi:electron-transferring-flavoprotein dehydrogenase
VAGDASEAQTKGYDQLIRDSFVHSELHRVRNFHQALSQGIFTSMPQIALQELTGGRGLHDPMPCEVDAKTTEPSLEIWGPEGLALPENQLPTPDGVMFFDKLSSVYLTGTMHDEDSPNHLILRDGDICRNICEPNYHSPCNLFCPAQVYEMVPAHTGEAGKKDLQINYTNCIHCKTCDIKCPFENIDWTVPEGGGGPRYTEV